MMMRNKTKMYRSKSPANLEEIPFEFEKDMFPPSPQDIIKRYASQYLEPSLEHLHKVNPELVPSFLMEMYNLLCAIEEDELDELDESDEFQDDEEQEEYPYGIQYNTTIPCKCDICKAFGPYPPINFLISPKTKLANGYERRFK